MKVKGWCPAVTLERPCATFMKIVGTLASPGRVCPHPSLTHNDSAPKKKPLLMQRLFWNQAGAPLIAHFAMSGFR